MALIRIGRVSFDGDSHRLFQDGAAVPLQEQPSRLLAYLIEHRDRNVSRQELIEHVWRDGRHVQFDQGLNYCIRRIRAVLGDEARSPKYIATIDRKHYRWVAPVTRAAETGRFSRLARHPVPAWLAGSVAASLVVMAMMLGSAPQVVRDGAVTSRGGEGQSALTVLHRMSHQWFDPLIVRFLDRD